MKKITKKWTAFMFVCLLAVGSLSACGQNSGANAGTGQAGNQNISGEAAQKGEAAPNGDTAQNREAAQNNETLTGTDGDNAGVSQGGQNGQSQPAAGQKHMKLGSTGYFTTSSADPGTDYNGWYESFMGMFETLYHLDADFVPQPWLAESYETPDDLTWIFTLREDVTFHNGEKMTAEQVKACFERTMEVNPRALSQIPIGSIEANGNLLTIKTTTPVPTMTGDLCDPLWVVYYTGDDCDYESRPFGTGPFEMTAYEQGVKTSVKAFDNYWGGRAKIDTADFLVVGDNDALTMAMQSGEVDMVVNPAASALSLFADTSKYTVDMVTGSRATTLHFNLDRPVVADINVRNAISMCIDREAYCQVLVNNTAEPSYGIFSTAMPYGGTDGLKLTVDAYDPEGARSLLESAGYADSDGDGILDKDGASLEMTIITFASRNELSQFCDALQSVLGEIGIKLNVEVMESTSDAQASGDFDLCLSSFAMAPTSNPSYFFNNRVVTGASGNTGHYSNPVVDELAGKLGAEFDTDQRNELTRQICQELVNDSYYIVFAHQKFITVYSTAVTGFSTHPGEYYLMDNKIDLQ